MKGKWMKIVRQYTIITLGISMMAVGVYFFKFPNNFVFGGVTGAAALAAKLTPISASEFSAVGNMLMLLLGLIFLGKEFALTTGYATVVLSAELMLLESGKSMMRYLPPNATAGLAISPVSTYRRLPWPPASSMAIHSFFMFSPAPLPHLPRLHLL